ncbi:hypothetical protein XELAEV_18033466mg [Xenopus laevis]|uniref:Uncharacterized protein n=1 Tax=Xenopus laevis TaxID=8355 RepID=A0A974CKF7_XENLA|nr:hypothetical protein XELAEV_18033466mg [Xenopus laevis]
MSFADIAATTDRRADMFSFTETERKKILNAAQPLPATCIQSGADALKKLEQLKRREVSWTLHTASLAEYAKAHRIPRGLRIKLQPALFKDNTEFLQKWRGILNRCSLDLITLTVQQLQIGTRELKQQLHAAEEEVKLHADAENTQLRELEVKMEKLQQEILQMKLRKFTRDTRDYERGEVYTWQDSRRRVRNYRRSDAISPDRSSVGTSDGGQESSASSQQSPVPFLGPSQAKRGAGSEGDKGSRNANSSNRNKQKRHYRR